MDIEFWGVSYMEVPDLFKGINIQRLINDIPERVNKFKDNADYKIYEVSSDGISYYVVAAGCRVGKNNWVNENRILNSDLEYDEILATL